LISFIWRSFTVVCRKRNGWFEIDFAVQENKEDGLAKEKKNYYITISKIYWVRKIDFKKETLYKDSGLSIKVTSLPSDQICSIGFQTDYSYVFQISDR